MPPFWTKPKKDEDASSQSSGSEKSSQSMTSASSVKDDKSAAKARKKDGDDDKAPAARNSLMDDLPPPDVNDEIMAKIGGNVVQAPGVEGELGLQLEEAEVLPYESVFEWDIQDPVGYYTEDDKYQQLRKVFGNDETKTAVIEGMWRDRIKYQVLRRFTWPPPLLFGQIFFTRGYYEDYESRPTVDIQWLHLGSDKRRQKEEAKMRKAGENRMNFQLGITSVERKESLSEFDPMVYKREVLVLSNLPNDITEEELKDLFPAGTLLELHDDGKSGKVAFIKFKNLTDAKAAYRLANKTTIRGKKMQARPLMHSEDMEQPDSLTGFDSMVYNQKVLMLYDLPSNTTKEELEKKFPNAIVTLESNGKGGFTASLRYKNLDHARAGYKYALNVGKDAQGNPFKVRPVLHVNDLGRKDSLTEFDERIYQRNVLSFRDLPKDTPIDFFKKLYPNGTVELIDDGKGGVTAEVTFKTFDESRAAYRTALNTKFRGKELKVMPKSKPRGSLSLFDPRLYHREILTLQDLPKNTSTQMIAKMFPKGVVVMKDNGKGGLTAEITFKNFADAKYAYRSGLKANINGKGLKISPKLKKDQTKDLDFLHKMKNQAKENKKPPVLPAVVTGQKTSLSEFDPLVYNRQVLSIKSIPAGITKAEFDTMFPTGSVEIKSDGKGGFNAEIKFKNINDARMAFRIGLKSKLKGQPMNILPIMRAVVTGQKTSLSEFDPLVYNRQVLSIKSIPAGITKAEFDTMFPTGSVEIKSDGKGGFNAEIEFKNINDARMAFRTGLKSKLKGQPMNILPIMRAATDIEGGLDGVDRKDVLYANPYMIKSKIQKNPLRSKTAPKGQKAKTTKRLNNYDPREYDYLTIEVTGIPQGTNRFEVTKTFAPRGDVKSLEPDFKRPGQMIAIVHYKTVEDAKFSYIDNHEQPLNGRDMKMTPAKLTVKKKVEKGEAMPDVPKNLTMYNPLEHDYLQLLVKKIPIGSNKQQVQALFRNGKVTKLDTDPLNKTIMVATVTETTKEDAIEDYKNALGKKLGGTEIVVVPAKWPEGGPPKKAN